ncbi:MAG: hypothetical protein Kow006_23430 [Gammaproteobacteria bacterium]
MKKAVGTASLVAALALALGGCATVTEADLESLRSEVRNAQETADRALSAAQSADRKADAAQAAANEARSVAQDARAATEATDARIDQMFKKAMMK